MNQDKEQKAVNVSLDCFLLSFNSSLIPHPFVAPCFSELRFVQCV